MNKLNRICVINAGRNGTTWLTMTVTHLLPNYTFCPGNDYFTHDSEDINIITPLPVDSSWILHCNWYPILRHIPEDTLILIPSRKDIFRVICSEIIAETTGEWGSYVITNFEPFIIDPAVFEARLNKLMNFKSSLDNELKQLNNRVIKCDFNDLLCSGDPRAEVIQMLATHGITDVNLANTNLVNTKSPLNHGNVILNYHELQARFNIC